MFDIKEETEIDQSECSSLFTHPSFIISVKLEENNFFRFQINCKCRAVNNLIRNVVVFFHCYDRNRNTRDAIRIIFIT